MFSHLKNITIKQRIKVMEAYYENWFSNRNAFRTLRDFYGKHNSLTEIAIGKIACKFKQAGLGGIFETIITCAFTPLISKHCCTAPLRRSVVNIVASARIWPKIQTPLFVIAGRNWTSPQWRYVDFDKTFVSTRLQNSVDTKTETCRPFEALCICPLCARAKTIRWTLQPQKVTVSFAFSSGGIIEMYIF